MSSIDKQPESVDSKDSAEFDDAPSICRPMHGVWVRRVVPLSPDRIGRGTVMPWLSTAIRLPIAGNHAWTPQIRRVHSPESLVNAGWDSAKWL